MSVKNSVEFSPRVLSGIQPTRGVHLGHYFGAIRHHIQLHHEYPGECFFFVADYHALTRGKDPDIVSEGTLELATSYLALGLDPEKAIFFRQSDVPAICELGWILSCLAPVGLLARSPVFKNAKARDRSAGVLSYPVLQAADIFSVQATLVPVGKDQLPALEIARDLADKFNTRFGSFIFPLPEPRMSPYPLIKGTDGRKMHPGYNNRIHLFDSYSKLRSKVNSILTDSKGVRDKKDPESCTIFHLYSLVASTDGIIQMREKYREGLIGYSDAKRELLIAIQEFFEPFQDKYIKLKNDPDRVLDILREGFITAKREASAVLDEVRYLVGLREIDKHRGRHVRLKD